TQASAQLGVDLGAGIAVEDLALGAQHLGQRPVDDARAERQAAPAQHPRCAVVARQAALELMQHARLAHACLADERDQMRRAVARDALVERLQLGELGFPSDERRARLTPLAGPAELAQLQRAPGRYRLGLALERQRLELAVVNRGLRRAEGPLADEG